MYVYLADMSSCHRLTSEVIPVDLEVVDGLVPRRSLAGAVVATAPVVDLHHHMEIET